MKKKKILFVYRTKRKHVYENWKRNKGPDSILFGGNHLRKLGYKVDIFDNAYSAFNLYHPLFYLLEHVENVSTFLKEIFFFFHLPLEFEVY